MKSLMIKAVTAWSLGLPSLGRVLLYRAGIMAGFNPVRRLTAVSPKGPFFHSSKLQLADCTATSAWCGAASLFGYWTVQLSDEAPPDWHRNLLNGRSIKSPERSWWQIPDFDPETGDIKVIWEASRFDWVLAFAQRMAAGDAKALDQMNQWLSDWCDKNPPYCGPNWKCGQEASIRIMHLAMASLLTGQHTASAGALLDLIRVHLQRIAPTISYAMAQDNNHGTSEAAALFIGGSWLARHGVKEGQRWMRLGRRWLENRAARLIGSDGSFSQYSLNYHRVMLDTFSMVEVWRKCLELPRFSERWYSRVLAATDWLYAMINSYNGDGPNVGANDGARLLQLTDTDYRDYRPAVQLAMALFGGARAYECEGSWNQPLYWLGLDVPERVSSRPATHVFDEGGFAVLRRGQAMTMLRYPRFRFRPSQADALHVDLWLGDRNLLRDAGTYSYNTDAQWLNYFPGTASHNTVQFDDRDQMPRLSRFLFGNWLKTSYLEPLRECDDSTSFAAGYRDGWGAAHKRHIQLMEHCLKITDHVEGFQRKAVLRWRLEPGDWSIEGNIVTDGKHRLEIGAMIPIARLELTLGWESRYYLQKEQVPVLEVEVHQSGVLTTEYHWNS